MTSISSAVPGQFPICGVTVYVTFPGLVPSLVKVCLICDSVLAV